MKVNYTNPLTCRTSVIELSEALVPEIKGCYSSFDNLKQVSFIVGKLAAKLVEKEILTISEAADICNVIEITEL